MPFQLGSVFKLSNLSWTGCSDYDTHLDMPVLSLNAQGEVAAVMAAVCDGIRLTCARQAPDSQWKTTMNSVNQICHCRLLFFW